MQIQASSISMAAEYHSVQRQRLSALSAASIRGESSTLQPPTLLKTPTMSASPLAVEQKKYTSLFPEQVLSSQLRMMKMILEMWLGKKIETELTSADGVSSGREGQIGAVSKIDELIGSEWEGIGQGRSGQGGVVSNNTVLALGSALSANGPDTYRLERHESEKTRVSIQADLTLRSGRTMEVDLVQSLSRSLDLSLELNASEAAKYIDPLVLNFGGPVKLSAERVSFDVNADGVVDSVASLSSASAYLALDKNGDGVINDGSELFGALSGNGFADLAQYDEDGNGFIDEGDAVFSRLLLFRPGDVSSSSFAAKSISSAGVEAIHTGSVDSPFRLTSIDGEDLGRVRSTGFHVGSYGANTVQQIDLVV